jgi:hypothetical protein
MGKLTTLVRPRHDIGSNEIAAMYRLYAEYYDATSQAMFRCDLGDKDYIIELKDGPVLRGFSTLALMDCEVAGKPCCALFSGDTIIDRSYWGEQALTRAFCRFAGSIKAHRPELRLYWFLISKGYRTYRYLSVFARDYFPNPSGPTPPHLQACIDTLARKRFGPAYCSELGLVRFPVSRGHLKPQWAAVRDGMRMRVEVQFFLNRNPRFHAGEELCCITLLETDNLRSFARRAFLEGLHDEHAIPLVPERRRGFEPFPQLAFAGPSGPRAPAPDYPPT